jgi:hypothetical protein
MKKVIIFAVIIILLVTIGIFSYWFSAEKSAMLAVKSFDDCRANGFGVSSSSPKTCKTPDGRIFTEENGIKPNDISMMIRVDSPKAGDTIKSPLTVAGEAVGDWYFEATFPVKILDSEGNVIAENGAKAQGDWMTTKLVPFTVTLTYPTTVTGTGTILLQKDNPSGLPENERELRIPIIFGTVATSSKNSNMDTTTSACKPTGCSSEICSDQDQVSSCIYSEKFACYKSAKCERQSDGKCGWTMTSKLNACLKK